MDAVLERFDYQYLPYELDLLNREISSLFSESDVTIEGRKILLRGISSSDQASLDRLTYIARYSLDGQSNSTFQFDLESGNANKQKRQNTRYATHGLHEYKGKYNPQIVRSIINILGLKEDSNIIDPFCGSGTTLVESALCGMRSVGTDINPLAVLMTNLKISALTMDCHSAQELLSDAYENVCRKDKNAPDFDSESSRIKYLQKWIPADTLVQLEQLRMFCGKIDTTIGLLFTIIASNLIRDYSFQEPKDLRIRKRISPFPEKPFIDAWEECVKHQIENILRAQQVYRNIPATGKAVLGDIRSLTTSGNLFDAAITSPPYATALPYIDTQRISIVWLGLCDPSEIMSLESSLIGSREFFHIDKQHLRDEMVQNQADLPKQVFDLIDRLNNNLSSSDGFRKKAVPMLLYRYFSDMQTMFSNVLQVIKPHGKYALVVGNNKTTIGGKLTVIDTPMLLSYVAEKVGWSIDELIPLQTYQRYGLNSKNAINQETLVILKKDA